MYFKKACIFKANKDFSISEEAIQVFGYKPIMPVEMVKTGFVPPYGENWVHSTNNNHLFVIRVDNRIIPSFAIKQRLEEACNNLAAKLGRKATGRERAQLKEDIIEEMKVGAPVKTRFIQAILTKDNWFIVDGSKSDSEDICSLIRKAAGSFPVVPLRSIVEHPIDQTLTEVLRSGKETPKLQLGYNYALSGAEQMAIKMKNVPRSNDELGQIAEYLEVDNIQFHSENGLTFTIDYSGFISGIEWSGQITEQNVNADDEGAVFDSTFFICSETLNDTVNCLLAVFGGLHQNFKDL